MTGGPSQGDQPTTGFTRTFDVFLSYSRKDAAFAAQLDKALRSYRPPKDLPVPQRRLNVFRDQTDMLGVELKRALGDQLNRASKLVVLCSPDARASPYVNHEIETFGRVRGGEHIVPVLVRGLPNNEARPAQERELAFPAALVHILPTPLAADFRGFRPTGTPSAGATTSKPGTRRWPISTPTTA